MTTSVKSVKQNVDKLEKLTDRLNKRMQRGKIKSKLIKGKTKIPGFGYWFKNR